MKLTSDLFERLPQAWVLVGLLIISSGVYLGFDYSVVFVYLGIGVMCTAYGLGLFVVLILDGPKRNNARPLSRDFISMGSTVAMPLPQADEEPTSNK